MNFTRKPKKPKDLENKKIMSNFKLKIDKIKQNTEEYIPFFDSIGYNKRKRSMYCDHCKKKTPINSIFCPYCGRSL